ncbi:protein of unknown function [Bartonella clarridgeiae 73]|uniref:Uncharacterized protein n=1 Tax=Bartonella clarridgeiae (strain CCUG 45776 / CIP 104772 / 73) TaxID=696125 RepID=E6YGV2_BARC7|nr:protein of unknown function [Bartonella clarridgeiae 73]
MPNCSTEYRNSYNKKTILFEKVYWKALTFGLNQAFSQKKMLYYMCYK